MDWHTIARELVFGGWELLLRLALIIIPLITIINVAEAYNVTERMEGLFRPAGRFLRIPSKGVIPLFIGLVFGIVNAAAVLIRYIDEGEFSNRELNIMGTVMALCHGIFEDTLVFVLVGANVFVVMGVRLGLSLLVIFLLVRTCLAAVRPG